MQLSIESCWYGPVGLARCMNEKERFKSIAVPRLDSLVKVTKLTIYENFEVEDFPTGTPPT